MPRKPSQIGEAHGAIKAMLDYITSLEHEIKRLRTLLLKREGTW